MPRLTQEFKAALFSAFDDMHRLAMQSIRIECNLGQVVSAQFRFPDPLVARFMRRRCQNAIGLPNSSDAEVQAEQDASMAEFESQSTSHLIQTYCGKYHEKFAEILIETLRKLDVQCPGFIATLAAISQHELMELMAPDSVGAVEGWPAYVRYAVQWHREWCAAGRPEGHDGLCDHQHVSVIMFMRAAYKYGEKTKLTGAYMSGIPKLDWDTEIAAFVEQKIKGMRQDEGEALRVQLYSLHHETVESDFLKHFM